MLPTKFGDNMPFCYGEEQKIDCQDGGHGGHIGSPIRTILAILIYKSPRCFLPSFKSIGLTVQEKKRKIDFQDGRLEPIGKILAIFDLRVTRMLSTFSNQLAQGVGGVGI